MDDVVANVTLQNPSEIGFKREQKEMHEKIFFKHHLTHDADCDYSPVVNFGFLSDVFF